MIILISLLAAIVILVGIIEIASCQVFGGYRSESKNVSKWLQSRVRLNSLDENMMMKFPDELGINFISKDPISIFTKWHVNVHSGYKRFRVLRGSKLHREIEETYQKLIQTGSFI